MLNRWFDPQSVGIHAASLTNILNPKKAKDMRELAGNIEDWKKLISRYFAKVGSEPINEPTRIEKLLSMLPPVLQDALRTWLLTNKSATYPVLEQLVYDRI